MTNFALVANNIICKMGVMIYDSSCVHSVSSKIRNKIFHVDNIDRSTRPACNAGYHWLYMLWGSCPLCGGIALSLQERESIYAAVPIT